MLVGVVVKGTEILERASVAERVLILKPKKKQARKRYAANKQTKNA